MTFEGEELTRYSRQLMLPGFGKIGQSRLRSSHVVILGVGGLGCPAATNLAAAGVGQLTLVDGDRVDLTNLHRQHLYTTSDVGVLKVEAAKSHLLARNPRVSIQTLDKRLGPSWSREWRGLVSAADLVIDGSDNFDTRYLVNRSCVETKTPLCYGSVYRYSGEVSTFLNQGGPCYACLHPRPPLPGTTPNCAEGGVLGVLPHLIGTLQATEALKILTGVGEPCQGRVLSVDIRSAPFFREWKFQSDSTCRVCSGNASETTEVMMLESTAAEVPEMSLQEIRRRQFEDTIELVDIRSEAELQFGVIGGSVHRYGASLQTFISEDISSDKVVVFHCKSGGRSRALVSRLREAGHSNVYSLQGDWDYWREQFDEALIRY